MIALEATPEPEIKEIGDQIAALTLKQAVELSNYLENVHGIEPARGGVLVQPPTDVPVQEEQTEFNVVLEGFGDKKLPVIKAFRSLKAGVSLGDAKKTIEEGGIIAEQLPKEEAERWKAALEEGGATVSLK